MDMKLKSKYLVEHRIELLRAIAIRMIIFETNA